MIVANTPGSLSHVYAHLLHAEWDGLTPTDFAFPSFLFIVGVSIVFALGKKTDQSGVISVPTLTPFKQKIFIRL